MKTVDVIRKYELTDEDVNEICVLLARMQKKYGEHYRDMIEVLYQLTEPTKKE